MPELKRTPLYDVHASLGAKMVPFAGFEMPVSYTGIIEEHERVRERVGLFDVSHMGEFTVRGPGTWRYLDRVVTNNCSRLPPDGVLYTVMCRENGTVVDDLLVSRIAEDEALVVVNAANIAKDHEHMTALLDDDVELVDESDDVALIAVQGPKSRELLVRCPTFAPIAGELGGVGYYRHRVFASDAGRVVVSRTGYTGELGFEVFLPPALAAPVWRELSEHGADLGVGPVGLAARDTLRFEACFCLYGHELDDDTSPLEAGLRWVVRMKKQNDFVGRDALARELQAGSKRRLVGLQLEGRNIARQGYPVLDGDAEVGRVTSGTFSPTLKKSLCLAMVDAAVADGDGLAVGVRGRRVSASRVETPFYPSRAR